MSKIGDKENNVGTEPNQSPKKPPTTQSKIIRDPNYKGKLVQKDKPQSSNLDKNEILQLQKGLTKINAKVDKLDKKLDHVIELLLGHKVDMIQTPATTSTNIPSGNKKENLPKFNHVRILKTPVSNNKPNTIEYPKLTSTPCHQIAFPPTPIQQFSPIPLTKNVVNQTNSNEGFMKSGTKTNSLKRVSAKKRKLSQEGVVHEPLNFNEEEGFKEEGVKDITPERQPENKEKTPEVPEYVPPVCLINSRSRARKQKQSAAALRPSTLFTPNSEQNGEEVKNMEEAKVEETKIEETKVEEAKAEIQVPTNEAVNFDTEPVDLKTNCETSQRSVAKRKQPVTRVDFSLTNSFENDQTADFLYIVASTKSTKIAAPVISKIDPMLRWPQPAGVKVLEKPQPNNDTLTKTPTSNILEKPEIARESTPIAQTEQTKPNEEIQAQLPKMIKSVKSKPKSQPFGRIKKMAIEKKKTLPPVKLVGSPKKVVDELNQDSKAECRPKRNVAPKNLAEPKLNIKMRRNS